MPYLQVTTNVPMNRKQKVLIDQAVSKSLVIIPEEKPEYLMSQFDDCASMILQGSDDPCVIIRLRVGRAMYDRYPRDWTKIPPILTEVVSKVLDIPKNRIYAVITDTNLWAYQGEDIMETLFKK